MERAVGGKTEKCSRCLKMKICWCILHSMFSAVLLETSREEDGKCPFLIGPCKAVIFVLIAPKQRLERNGAMWSSTMIYIHI